MNIKVKSDRSCRYCSFYRPQGRRGGACQRLNVPVESSWQACSLCVPSFETEMVPVGEAIALEMASSRR